METAQQIIITPFDPTCAWCLKAHGLLEEQQEGSHGICPGHVQIVLQERQSRKARKGISN